MIKKYLSSLEMTAKTKERLCAGGAFLLLFAYFWRATNPFSQIPAYGDALEVVWGIIWYNHAITEWVTPFSYPLIFHPVGWNVGILAHTPLLFLLSQPFYFIGGELFAYNMMAIVSLVIAYIGSLRFFKCYTRSQTISFTVIVASLVFTFVIMRSGKIGGHLHALWATCFFPWLGYHLVQWRDMKIEKLNSPHVIWSGIFFGLIIGFSLYGVFWAPVVFLLLERRLFRWRTVVQLLVVAVIALGIGSTALVPYLVATRSESVNPANVYAIMSFSSSVNTVFIPSINHPIPFLNDFANTIYQGVEGEGGQHSVGLTTLLFVLIGGVSAWRERRYGRLLVFIVGLIFALGPLVKYDGNPIGFDFLIPLNEFLWPLAHRLKPDVFPDPTVTGYFLKTIPLPSFFLLMFAPFWEGARTTARFMLVAFLGVLGLSVTGIEKFPTKWRTLLLIIWLIEMLPVPIAQLPLNRAELHPAHEWLAGQILEPGQGVIDVRHGGVYHGPEPLYISWQTQQPTASSIGSFFPEHQVFIKDETSNWVDHAPAYIARLLQAYQVQYVMMHRVDEETDVLWEQFSTETTYFSDRGCFTPSDDYRSPWDYPICVLEINPHPTIFNVHPSYGMSAEEPWGIWAIDKQPRFNFVSAAEQSHVVIMETFPHCLDGQQQTLKMIVHEELLYEYQWDSCDAAYAEIIIPAEAVAIGWNEIRFELAYALSQTELGLGSDPRPLSIGFNRLEVRPIK